MKHLRAKKDLSEFIIRDKYARYLPELKRRETHAEAVNRTMNMHRKRFPKLVGRINEVERALINHEILPSQRTLQFGGDAVVKKNMRAYNCGYSHVDRIEFLQEKIWLALCGVGTGYSVYRHNLEKLPTFRKRDLNDVREFVIEDSIEGWADSFRALLDSFIDGHVFAPNTSKIRPEGSPISSSSQPAPGPKELVKALYNIEQVLIRVVEEHGGRLRSIDLFDIVCHASMCVRAGGIRRSADICLFDVDDELMMTSKTGDWYSKNPQRQMANISATILVGTLTFEQLEKLTANTFQFGEPGFHFTTDLDFGLNPCAEIHLNPILRDSAGNVIGSGWSFCNLTSVNVAKCVDKPAFLRACANASFLGTLQADYMDLGYLGGTSPVTKQIMERDMLIGVSLTGIANNKDFLTPEVMQAGALAVVRTNDFWAKQLGFNPSARCTTVKPEGTGSLLLQVESGVTPAHELQYLRLAEGGKLTSPLVQFMREHIPEAVLVSPHRPEECKLAFPIDLTQQKDKVWLKRDTTALKHMEFIKSVQANWVIPGTTRGSVHNNVANTVEVRPHEQNDVNKYLFENQEYFGGIALLPTHGDAAYDLAPFISVLPEEERVTRYGHNAQYLDTATRMAKLYDTLCDKWPENLDWTSIEEQTDNSAGVESVACAGGACLI